MFVWDTVLFGTKPNKPFYPWVLELRKYWWKIIECQTMFSSQLQPAVFILLTSRLPENIYHVLFPVPECEKANL